jgi:hypothetical protein
LAIWRGDSIIRRGGVIKPRDSGVSSLLFFMSLKKEIEELQEIME